MKLTILGNNGPFPSVNGATSGYLLEVKNKQFVMDFGSGVLSNLQKNISVKDVSAIIISHLHFDHISDLGVLAYYLQVNKLGKLPLYVPEANDYINMILKTGCFTCHFYSEGELDVSGVKFSVVKMKHPVESFSFSVEEEGKVFSYTGDTNYCPQVEELFKKSNFVLCDTAFLKESWNENLPHMNIFNACELAKKFECKVVLTHLNPNLTEDEILNEAFGNFEIAKINKSIII